MFSFKTDKPKQLSFKPGEYVDIWNLYHYDGQVVSRPYMFPVWEKELESLILQDRGQWFVLSFLDN